MPAGLASSTSTSVTAPFGMTVNLSFTQPATPSADAGHVGVTVCLRVSVDADTKLAVGSCSAEEAGVAITSILDLATSVGPRAYIRHIGLGVNTDRHVPVYIRPLLVGGLVGCFALRSDNVR